MEEDDGDYRVRGGLFGGTLGYNWQNNLWLYGLEGDFSWSGIKGSSNICGTDHVCGTDLKSLGTARGRVGYIFGDMAAFATGGIARGNVYAYDVQGAASGSKTRLGWIAGGGLEKQIASRWSAKIEYLYVDLGKDEYFQITNRTPERVDFQAHIIRAGINYKFDWGKGPIVTKY